MSKIGVVTIGRNEGDRLVRCLKSLRAQLSIEVPIIYVDSGSTDNSVAMAEALGVRVINLDLSIPFTMARGRNTGFQFLVEQFPELEYVQFIDGDCELMAGWLEKAIAPLECDENLAIVCGRRRERFPDASIYNRLADMEWNTPIGAAMACGGDALMRVAAIQQVGGYNEALIAGEEPEMCVRLRHLGWKILRIDAEMTLHDAAMTQFGQWWKRMVRGGWAMAAAAALHGAPPDYYRVKDNISCWVWCLLLPLVAIALISFSGGFSLLLLGLYGLSAGKVATDRWRQGDTPADAWLYGGFCVMGKFAETQGQMRYWLTRWQGQPATLIEYKAPIAATKLETHS